MRHGDLHSGAGLGLIASIFEAVGKRLCGSHLVARFHDGQVERKSFAKACEIAGIKGSGYEAIELVMMPQRYCFLHRVLVDTDHLHLSFCCRLNLQALLLY